MRKLVSPTAALALVACSGTSYPGVTDTQGSPPTPVATTNVTLKSLAFIPSAIQVTPGATVQFTNDDGITHNVTFSSGAITGVKDFSSGTQAVVMPIAPGTYAFKCTIHPQMTGTVLVK